MDRGLNHGRKCGEKQRTAAQTSGSSRRQLHRCGCEQVTTLVDDNCTGALSFADARCLLRVCVSTTSCKMATCCTVAVSCALTPPTTSQVKMSKRSPYGTELLRHNISFARWKGHHTARSVVVATCSNIRSQRLSQDLRQSTTTHARCSHQSTAAPLLLHRLTKRQRTALHVHSNVLHRQ